MCSKSLADIKPLVVLQILCILGFSSLVFAKGEVQGFTLEKGTHKPLMNANVIVVGTQMSAITGPDGRFVISDLPIGVYTLEASMKGYETPRVENISIEENASIEVNFELRKETILLSEIVVTPGRFALMQKEPTVRQTLKRDDLRSVPQLGEDIYRAVRRLPGLTGDDYSAKFTVRGGENDEVLVLLDGMELYEPFHLKDINGGALSIIDVETIGGIDMMTGAFPAEYGDRLSGVFDMKSAKPSVGLRRTSLAISFMNTRFLSEGYFNDQKGHWLVAARRGYLDLVLKLIGEDENISPTYYDISGKIAYDLNAKHSLSGHMLWAEDDLDLVEDEDTTNTGYGNGYTWLTWRANLHPKLFARTVFSVGRVDLNRRGTDISRRDGEIFFEVKEKCAFNILGLKQDWSTELSDRHLLTAGFNVKRLTASYDYMNMDRISTRIVDGRVFGEFNTIESNLSPSGVQVGVYLGDRLRLTDPLTAEVGVRYDHTSWADDNTVSPRLNLAYVLGERTVLRGGWGRFYQTQGIHELHVQDGDENFYPAELAEHRVVGLEHVFDNEVSLRVEAYQKMLSDIHPRYQNLFNEVEFFPEVVGDRIRLEPEDGEAKGIEIFLKRDTGDRLSWWASYGLAFAEDGINGRTVPRNRDQRHTVYLDLNYRPNEKWRINVAWQFHTGWPYTAQISEPIFLPDGTFFGRDIFFGPVNGERFPPYHRLDFRVHRYFHFATSPIFRTP